ncbi:MAG: DUF3168 domain-containing protein [Candidatus Omnitrophica bacterium]|nr:DUF3168 domain-containing protein [Candidatus Omnitrophota bacterium]
MSKTTGSAISSDVGGRIYLDQAPEGVEFPYVVFQVVSDVPNNVFNKTGENVLIQFSLFSSSEGAAEITDMYADLKTLFDDATLTITGSTCINMARVNTVTMVEDITTTEGAQAVKHWAVDYLITTQAS